MASVTLNFSISAIDNNISKCAYVWHRLVDSDLTTELTQWSVDTYDTNNSSIVISEILNNNTLKTCGSIFLEVYIIPCCALGDIIQNVNCTNCTSLPSNTSLPSVIPSVSIHQYHEITASSISNILIADLKPLSGYVIQQSNYYNVKKIRITGNTGCILGGDGLCTPVNQIVIYDTFQMNNGPLLAYFCDATPTFEYYDGIIWQPFTNYTKVGYKSQYGCYFDTVLLKIINNDDASHALVTYQKKDGTFANISVSPLDESIVCTIKNTWFLNNNGINQSRVLFEILSVC